MERESFFGPEISKVLQDAIADLKDFHREATDFANGTMFLPETWRISRRQALGEILYILRLDPHTLHQALKEVLELGGLPDLYPGVRQGLKAVLHYPLDPQERKPFHKALVRIHEIETRYAVGGVPGVHSLDKAQVALRKYLDQARGYSGPFSSIYSVTQELATR